MSNDAKFVYDNKRELIACQIFCNMMIAGTSKVNPSPMLGHQQAKIAFVLADTFMVVAKEVREKKEE